MTVFSLWWWHQRTYSSSINGAGGVGGVDGVGGDGGDGGGSCGWHNASSLLL